MSAFIGNSNKLTYNYDIDIRQTKWHPMNTQDKLTLRLDKKLILQAKIEAKKSGRSLSRVVADYFSLLGNKEEKKNETNLPITSFLKGALKNKKIDREDYYRHLEDKYL